MLPIHERVPDLVERSGNQKAAEEAGFIFGVGKDKFPTFLPMALLFQAQGAALAGRGRQTVVDAGTAVESMVALVLREGMRAKGRSDSEIEAHLDETKWKTLYNRDLLEILGVPVGQGGAEHAKWWRVHYPSRNEVVHAGAVPSQDDVSAIVSDTWDLFDWIGQKARAHPDLSAFGKSITVRRK